MGKLTPGASAADRADFVKTGTMAAAGAGPWFALRDQTNLSLWGDFAGEVVLERSFDGGTTALVCTALGAPVIFKAPATEVLDEPESGVLFRINFRVRTGGTLNWRVSR